MPQKLFGYLRSSRAFMLRQLDALEAKRVKLIHCVTTGEVDVSDLAIEQLRAELKKVEELISIYDPDAPPPKKKPEGFDR